MKKDSLLVSLAKTKKNQQLNVNEMSNLLGGAGDDTLCTILGIMKKEK